MQLQNNRLDNAFWLGDLEAYRVRFSSARSRISSLSALTLNKLFLTPPAQIYVSAVVVSVFCSVFGL